MDLLLHESTSGHLLQLSMILGVKLPSFVHALTQTLDPTGVKGLLILLLETTTSVIAAILDLVVASQRSMLTIPYGMVRGVLRQVPAVNSITLRGSVQHYHSQLLMPSKQGFAITKDEAMKTQSLVS
jgi:hypothetical protein